MDNVGLNAAIICIRLNAICCIIVIIQVFGRGHHPDPVFVVFIEVIHHHVVQPLFRAEILKLIAVEAAHSIVGAEPEEAVAVLQHLINLRAGQAVFGGVVAESRLGRLAGEEQRAEEDAEG